METTICVPLSHDELGEIIVFAQIRATLNTGYPGTTEYPGEPEFWEDVEVLGILEICTEKEQKDIPPEEYKEYYDELTKMIEEKAMEETIQEQLLGASPRYEDF